MNGDFDEDEFEGDDLRPFVDYVDMTGSLADCHMDRHGYCGKAGSEECEFECPIRAGRIGDRRASR